MILKQFCRRFDEYSCVYCILLLILLSHKIIILYDAFMKLLVGLGNPGKEYENTRHNVGFRVIDSLAHSGWLKSKSGQFHYSWIGDELELIKPQTFMNKSGEAVASAMGKHKILLSDVVIVHDDLDIRLGEYKINFGKGPKVHNGINSIIDTLGSDQFWRVRIGIENRQEGVRIPGKTYVLQNFSQDEEVELDNIVKKIVDDMREKFLA